MSNLALAMTFLMGLTGSLHCAGMCGPIIWVMPFQMLQGVRRWAGLGLYHFGRISVYAILALLLHSFKSFFDPHWQQYISIALGAGLLIAGLFSFFPGTGFTLPWAGVVKDGLGRFIGRPGLFALLVSGILNGMLPCGLVYMALSASITAHTASQSMLLMYAFGSGTLPMLITLTVLRGRLKLAGSASFRKFVPVIMFLFGGLFMLRGMNLGIPYVSPKITTEHNEVKASCCHKSLR